jgi:hypothetical protein
VKDRGGRHLSNGMRGVRSGARELVSADARRPRDAFEPVKSAGGHIPVDLVPVQTSTHKSRRVSATQEI